MKEDYYPELVEVFYNNVKEMNRDISSRVKGVDIRINIDTWLKLAGLKSEGNLSHQFDCHQNQITRKREMFKNCMRYRGRYRKKDVYLLNAIMQRVQTNWVVVFKWHILDVGINDGHRLPYGVFISKVLEQSGVNLSGEKKLSWSRENLVGKATLTCIEKMDEIFKHYIDISSSLEESVRKDVDDKSEESSIRSSESE
ncbi:hypothetical protein V8G54_022660 [Vigna mungo]|uniref:Uncharacterized protein n=1 Tax=Vigna mungo TaxID=3915 RepID=A0AAQ3RNG9_VIGMU